MNESEESRRSAAGPDDGDRAGEGLFRDEAVRHHAAGRTEGEVLRLTPSWMRWTFWLLLALVGGGAAFLVFGRASEYASGPAIVRAEGRGGMTAPEAGTVAEILAGTGRAVRAGDPVVRFRDEREAAGRERMRREFEWHLVARLRDPGDMAAGQALAALRAEMELADARLRQRTVRAPRDGVVSDLFVREGQHVEEGQIVAALAPVEARFSLVALLPGHYRPMLRAGQPLRVEMEGYRSAYRWLTVEEVGEQVIGPAEARRVLGPGSADAVGIEGPVVIVRASFPTPTFRALASEQAYHDGMAARAEVPVRSERILFTLLPGLRGAFGGGEGS